MVKVSYRKSPRKRKRIFSKSTSKARKHYLIEAIVAGRILEPLENTGGEYVVEYKVKWSGYSAKHNQWVNERNFRKNPDAQQYFDSFWRSVGVEDYQEDVDVETDAIYEASREFTQFQIRRHRGAVKFLKEIKEKQERLEMEGKLTPFTIHMPASPTKDSLSTMDIAYPQSPTFITDDESITDSSSPSPALGVDDDCTSGSEEEQPPEQTEPMFIHPILDPARPATPLTGQPLLPTPRGLLPGPQPMRSQIDMDPAYDLLRYLPTPVSAKAKRRTNGVTSAPPKEVDASADNYKKKMEEINRRIEENNAAKAAHFNDNFSQWQRRGQYSNMSMRHKVGDALNVNLNELNGRDDSDDENEDTSLPIVPSDNALDGSKTAPQSIGHGNGDGDGDGDGDLGEYNGNADLAFDDLIGQYPTPPPASSPPRGQFSLLTPPASPTIPEYSLVLPSASSNAIDPPALGEVASLLQGSHIEPQRSVPEISPPGSKGLVTFTAQTVIDSPVEVYEAILQIADDPRWEVYFHESILGYVMRLEYPSELLEDIIKIYDEGTFLLEFIYTLQDEGKVCIVPDKELCSWVDNPPRVDVLERIKRCLVAFTSSSSKESITNADMANSISSMRLQPNVMDKYQRFVVLSGEEEALRDEAGIEWASLDDFCEREVLTSQFAGWHSENEDMLT